MVIFDKVHNVHKVQKVHLYIHTLTHIYPYLGIFVRMCVCVLYIMYIIYIYIYTYIIILKNKNLTANKMYMYFFKSTLYISVHFPPEFFTNPVLYVRLRAVCSENHVHLNYPLEDQIYV